MNWKFFVRMALPMVRMAGEQFKNEDENTTGKDDMVGISLTYAADLIEAAINGTTLPKAPSVLK
ncbi:MAG: hypothetical protein ACKVRN_10870 [Pyrinomonadaceae bacterium]